ncbi:MAG: VWA domain-containing protein [Rhodoferax sp.]|nr:VWA domain-containing protein [Rhodoferax sp.]
MSLIDTMAALHWRWPAAASLLLWPFMATWWAWRQRQRVQTYADAALRPWAVIDNTRGPAGHWRRAGEWLAWTLLAAALAGPRLPSDAADTAQAPPRHAVDVMVVLDVSASMRETDVVPERLTRARLELADLLQRLHGERLGLVAVAGQAGLLLPLTDDKALFEDALAQASADLIEARGSDTAAGLVLARQALATSVPGSRAVLLVTDAEVGDLAGEAGEALKQTLQALGSDGLPVYVLAVSVDGGAQAADGAARAPDHDAWRTAARRSGGLLASVADGSADWDALYGRGIARLPGAPVPPERARAWRELFFVPLLAALGLLMVLRLPPGALHARGSAAAAFALLVLVTMAPDPVQAQPSTPTVEQQAWAAWHAGQWPRAQALYERQGGVQGASAAGAAALKAGDAAAAQRLFSRALMLARSPAARTDALYNLAHAHAAQGRWDTAAEAWQAVLAARPGDVRATTNLAVARTELARQQREQPIASDLRGRHGFIAEGHVATDGSTDRETPALEALGPRREAGREVGGAILATTDKPDGGDAGFTVDARHLTSGLAKIGRLGDPRAALLKGLVKQDRSGTPRQGLQPW